MSSSNKPLFALSKNLHTGRKYVCLASEFYKFQHGFKLKQFNPISKEDFNADQEYGRKEDEKHLVHYFILALSDSEAELRSLGKKRSTTAPPRKSVGPVQEEWTKFKLLLERSASKAHQKNNKTQREEASKERKQALIEKAIGVNQNGSKEHLKGVTSPQESTANATSKLKAAKCFSNSTTSEAVKELGQGILRKAVVSTQNGSKEHLKGVASPQESTANATSKSKAAKCSSNSTTSEAVKELGQGILRKAVVSSQNGSKEHLKGVASPQESTANSTSKSKADKCSSNSTTGTTEAVKELGQGILRKAVDFTQNGSKEYMKGVSSLQESTANATTKSNAAQSSNSTITVADKATQAAALTSCPTSCESYKQVALALRTMASLESDRDKQLQLQEKWQQTMVDVVQKIAVKLESMTLGGVFSQVLHTMTYAVKDNQAPPEDMLPEGQIYVGLGHSLSREQLIELSLEEENLRKRVAGVMDLLYGDQLHTYSTSGESAHGPCKIIPDIHMTALKALLNAMPWPKADYKVTHRDLSLMVSKVTSAARMKELGPALEDPTLKRKYRRANPGTSNTSEAGDCPVFDDVEENHKRQRMDYGEAVDMQLRLQSGLLSSEDSDATCNKQHDDQADHSEDLFAETEQYQEN